MIDFYTWITPNGLKISIALEEFGLPYKTHTIDITRGDQFSAGYLAINPGSKIPAIVDHETGITLAESGAILLYLAEKTGRFLPREGAARHHTIEWLMWQMGGFGPTLGHAHYFLTYNEGRAPFAEALFRRDIIRLYETLDARLDGREHLVETIPSPTWPSGPGSRALCATRSTSATSRMFADGICSLPPGRR